MCTLKEIEQLIDHKLSPVVKIIESIGEVYVTRKEAAKIVGVTPNTITNYLKKGLFKGYYRGGNLEYKLTEILTVKNKPI